MSVKGKQKMAAVETSNFTTLASVDVSKFTKSRSGRKYLSWSHAAHQLLRHFPQAEMEVVTNEEGHPFFKTELGYFVHCKVTVEGITREQWYPVWDNKYETIGTPTASDINNSIQRGMTKTIALHGLGLHVYANEDLPLEEVVEEDDKTVENGSNGEIDAASMKERQGVWTKLVGEARVTFADETYKGEIHDKLVELYGDEGKIETLKGAYKLSEYPQSSDEAKQVLTALPVHNLNQAYQELFPDLVEE